MPLLHQPVSAEDISKWRRQRSRGKDLCGGRQRGYSPGKPGLTPMPNGGPWEAGGLGAGPGSAICCAARGSPFPEPQSPHLYNGTVQEPLHRVVLSVQKSNTKAEVMRLGDGHFWPRRGVKGTQRT